MSLIPDEVIEQVRDAVDLVGMIGEQVELKRMGSDWRGPCPFHGGTNRNFAVIPKKGRYYCFVCKESGDAFSYLMKRTGMDYPTAVREVARRVGITIPDRTERAGPDPREPLFNALSAAQDWFHRQLLELPDARVAREYLAKRGLDIDTVAPFGLGFAPRDGSFQAAMTTLGIKQPTLLEAGLLVQRDDQSIAPRFRGRLLFPITDIRGRTVAFGGRLLGLGEPKYLNSPETPVFHKGGTLYNLHSARLPIRKEGSVIIVEGYFDVLRLVLAGVDHVVAPLGTALTTEQATLVKSYAPLATLLLDSDSAGLRATFRSADVLLRQGMRVRVATMPAGEDPDTLVQKGGAAALEPILRDAIDVLDRKIQILERKGWFEGLEHRRDALDRLLPTLRAAHDPITRELYLARVSEQTGIDKKVLEQEVAASEQKEQAIGRGSGPADGRTDGQPGRRLGGQQYSSADGGRDAGTPPVARRVGAKSEKEFLAILLNDGDWLERGLEAARPEWFETPEFREIFEALKARPVGDRMPAVESLGDSTQRAWAAIRERAEALAGLRLDDNFVTLCEELDSRPLVRGINHLNDKITLASQSERDVLVVERQSLIDELKRRFPAVNTRRHWDRNRASRADGRQRT
ncbi:MAG: DNA primase [Gemmatimonadota bacterium]